MNHCGSFGMCGRRADCADHNCPGRVEPVGYEAAWKPEPEPIEPAMRSVSRFLLVVAGAFAAVAIWVLTN